MERNEQESLLYHSLHGRMNLRGCLPLAFLLVAGMAYGVICLVDVVMPQRILPRGEGQIYYRNDELIHFQVRQRTPLPLNVPIYVDPARQETASVVEADGRVPAKPYPAPAFDYLLVAPDSVVLGEADLLAMPPAKGEAPAAAAGGEEETQPAAGEQEKEVQP